MPRLGCGLGWQGLGGACWAHSPSTICLHQLGHTWKSGIGASGGRHPARVIMRAILPGLHSVQGSISLQGDLQARADPGDLTPKELRVVVWGWSWGRVMTAGNRKDDWLVQQPWIREQRLSPMS